MASDIAAVIRRIKEDLEFKVNRTVQNFCADVTIELWKRTPVDTGNARQNWVWDTEERDQPYGSKEHVDTVALWEGLRRVHRWTVRQGNLVLNNAVDYVMQGRDPRGVTGLDSGYSPQAPPNFVQIAIEKIIRRYQ